MHKRIKVDIAFITPGMFIAQLDRSWLETPFAMRGFEIREESEITLLRKFCKHVYVDATRGTLSEQQILDARASAVKDPFATPGRRHDDQRRASFGRKLLELISKFDFTGTTAKYLSRQKYYRTSVSTQKEAPHAAAAYGVMLEKMAEILNDVKNARGVDVEKLKSAVAPMVDSVLRNPDAMAWLCYLRKGSDPCVTPTSAVWAVILGRHLGFDRYALGNLAMGGILLDIGHAKIPSTMVSKNGPPTEEEESILRMHVDYGVQIARTVPGINDHAIEMIQCHHERHDGSGYPQGLSGEEIPIFGRIAGLINSYDRMITPKSYTELKSSYDAICELNLVAGTKFQVEVVEQFVKAIGMFPTGSLVELNTGEVAIVVEQNQEHRLRPKLMVVLDKKKERLSTPRSLDLSKVPSHGNQRKAWWIDKGFEAGAFDIDPKGYYFGAGELL